MSGRSVRGYGWFDQRACSLWVRLEIMQTRENTVTHQHRDTPLAISPYHSPSPPLTSTTKLHAHEPMLPPRVDEATWPFRHTEWPKPCAMEWSTSGRIYA